jgi:hypothetical protein
MHVEHNIIYLMAYHAVDTGQVDPKTQHDCWKFGPVEVDKLINYFKTHLCAFNFDCKQVHHGGMMSNIVVDYL